MAPSPQACRLSDGGRLPQEQSEEADRYKPDPITLTVDRELHAIEQEIDWLARLSPLDNEERWIRFRDSGYTTSPALTYPRRSLDVDGLRTRLDDVPLESVEHSVLRPLLVEKHAEQHRFLALLEAQHKPGFTEASVALFGGNEPTLLADALEILTTVPADVPFEHDAFAGSSLMVGAEALVEEAMRLREQFQIREAAFDFPIFLVDDMDAGLVVHQGELHVDRSLRIPECRVRALVAHEVGVHVLTHHNGSRQPLSLFGSGLAGYDALQEGLAILAEYLAGCLPSLRLRELAARVVAADLAVRHEPLETQFSVLHEEHALEARMAFDVAVRACRGGGLTKDAVYLAGLREVLACLSDSDSLALLFLGKFALSHRQSIQDLLDDGVLLAPRLLPEWLTATDAEKRIQQAHRTPLVQFHHSRVLP